MGYDPLDNSMPRLPAGWTRVCKGRHQDYRRREARCWIIRNRRTGVYAATWDGNEIARVTDTPAVACIAAIIRRTAR